VIAMPQSRNNSRRQKQAGYSLLMAVFMVATMMLLTSAAALRIDTQGRREREAELVWRGQQYQRAIGLYFRKFGKYPTKVDDLVKQTNGVRFLRQAYAEPMNKEDGSWRFIYVGPSGQLIGSLRRTSLLQTLISTPTLPGGATPFGLGPQPPSAPGATPGGAAGTAGQGGQPTNSAQTPDPLQSQPQPLQGAVIGGNIIGVASKVKQSSLRVYDGGDTYELWEFIWNPQQQIAIPGQGQQGVGANPSNSNGTTTAPGVPLPTPPAGTPPPGTPPDGTQPQQNPTVQ
jgi:hypothetical protein